ncbi:MAG: single-stranded DNA-binding protein [Saprospiraceae bacterium]|jgi:single-strand DNA-binding protein|nr:single-stranded DNA-binding protein [Saprospiraceae bacterium]MBL0023629.1 single-stranded DNA-binding protein [Saprospiraceae bacterium]
MINKVTLVGNLGRDPEIRTLENGTKVGTFSIATNESYKDKNDTWQTLTEWHNIVVWRGLAEKAERELKKGGLAYIEGKITHRKYQDKDGQEKAITEIVANTLYSLERRENKGSSLSAGFPGVDDDPFNKAINTSSTPSSTSQEPPAEDDLPF